MTPAPLRIAYLTAGAAGMYCGSCMHDNTLAAALTRLGVDIQLIPTYTPIRTDEADISVDRVFFGGINVYLQQKFRLFRYVPAFLDRFLSQPWLLRWATAQASEISPEELGALTVSMLRGTHGFQAKEVRRLCDWLAKSQQPNLVMLSNLLIGGCIPELKRRLRVPVLVTLQGDDIFLESLPDKYKSQALAEIRRLATEVDGFIVHSRYYADFTADYFGIPHEKLNVVPLGIDTRDFERRPANPLSAGTSEDRQVKESGSGRASTPARHEERDGQACSSNDSLSSSVPNVGRPPSAPAVDSRPRPTVGYLARLAPEKGLHVLVEAFLRLRKLPGMQDARLLLAGWLSPAQRGYAEAQFARLRDAGLGEAFQYLGVVDRAGKIEFLRQLDVFSVPTTYREPKGLFVLEALAAGVPVVQPRHGAFPEILAATGGGLLTAPEDPAALAHALCEVLSDPAQRRQLGETGRRAVHERFHAQAMAQATLAVFEKYAGQGT